MSQSPIVFIPKFKRRSGRSVAARIARRQQSYSYTPLQVAAAYNLPIDKYDGTSQTIGIISLGGMFYQEDLTNFLGRLGRPNNTVTVVSVNGAQMQPDPGGADVENMLDSCIIAALAPRANIRFYTANNTDTDFAAAVARAVSECDVVSISWGGPETGMPAASRQSMDAAIRAGTVNGINVYVASGDNGSRDGTNTPVTDYPSSCPFAVGCGGTNLQFNGMNVLSETVWNDGSQGGATGGGFSRFYNRPSFQNGIVINAMRGVPDVCGVADPETGWTIMANGQLQNVGGTSAVAPMWAAINALLNQAAGKRIGFADLLYYNNLGWFNDTITGTNGDYSAGPGWDACTGLGSPNGRSLFSGVTMSPSPVPAPIPAPPPAPVPAPPPPSPAPTPTPDPRQYVDGLFAQLESVLANYPRLVWILKYLQAEVDAILAGSGQNAEPERWPWPILGGILGGGYGQYPYPYPYPTAPVGVPAPVEVAPTAGTPVILPPPVYYPPPIWGGGGWPGRPWPGRPHDLSLTTISPAQIQQLIDSLIAVLQTLLAGNPNAEKILALIKVAADAILSQSAAEAHVFGLPPGTIVGGILKLLPVILQIIGAFGGGKTGG